LPTFGVRVDDDPGGVKGTRGPLAMAGGPRNAAGRKRTRQPVRRTLTGKEATGGRSRTMKALASAIVAVAILMGMADGLGHAWASPATAQIKARAWGGRGAGRPGWGPRAGWRGPGVWWGGPRIWWGGPAFGFGWGAGPWWGPGWGPGWAGVPPAVVVQPSPQVFIEQSPAPAVAAPVPPQSASPPPGPHYWYYCAGSRTYFPYVRECPDGWMTVVPPSSPSQ
jgi:hypothetical protein